MIHHSYSKAFLFKAFWNSLYKLNPFALIHNPVIFITEVGAFITTFEWIFLSLDHKAFYSQVTIWLWLTVLFANFAEAIAEARNQAQAESLRRGRVTARAHVKQQDGSFLEINADQLKKDDLVLVKEGEVVPGDGEIMEGLASIDESSVTGESEPVIRGAGTDRNSVTSGTKVLSDQILIRISSEPGNTFLDKMINLIESAKRKKSANEIALTILLSGLAFVFLVVVVSIDIFASYFKVQFSVTMLVALLVCLIPTTIAGLLSAIGIAGINRLMQKNVLARSGQAVEAAGDVDLILIDKTGTITLGNRRASEVAPLTAAGLSEFVKAAYFSSIEDTTDEGRSIIEFLQEHHKNLIPQDHPKVNFIPFTAQTRMSGADLGQDQYRKGSLDSIERWIDGPMPGSILEQAKIYAQQGGTPLVVCTNKKVVGIVLLKDIIKKGLPQIFERLRSLGIKVVMMTGDNPITAAVIAKETKVDDFIAQVSPEQKLENLLKMQQQGLIVAMTGDGVNDAPALAHADVGLAMNSGTQAAKEAGNMIDLDSHPTKLFEIIEIGKQMLMTRGALTTFSIANDVAKYFAILPAILIPYFPSVHILNLMRLQTPQSAVLSAVIFNALIIPILIPLAFRGVRMIPVYAAVILRRNLVIYGLGGLILPFIGIKLIDMLFNVMGWI